MYYMQDVTEQEARVIVNKSERYANRPNVSYPGMVLVGQIDNKNPKVDLDTLTWYGVHIYTYNSDGAYIRRIRDVLAGKDDFSVGDKVLFFKSGSVIPPDSDIDFLVDRDYTVSTLTVKGNYSSNLILPLPDDWKDLPVGEDVTFRCGVRKLWPFRSYDAGYPVGAFPGHLAPKPELLSVAKSAEMFEYLIFHDFFCAILARFGGIVQCVMYPKDGSKRVCSKNHEVNIQSTVGEMTYRYDLDFYLKGSGLALYWELIGKGTGTDPYKSNTQTPYVFHVYNMEEKRFYTWQETMRLCESIGIPHSWYLGGRSRAFNHRCRAIADNSFKYFFVRKDNTDVYYSSPNPNYMKGNKYAKFKTSIEF